MSLNLGPSAAATHTNGGALASCERTGTLGVSAVWPTHTPRATQRGRRQGAACDRPGLGWGAGCGRARGRSGQRAAAGSTSSGEFRPQCDRPHDSLLTDRVGVAAVGRVAVRPTCATQNATRRGHSERDCRSHGQMRCSVVCRRPHGRHGIAELGRHNATPAPRPCESFRIAHVGQVTSAQRM